jgi:hypothetical protein
VDKRGISYRNYSGNGMVKARKKSTDRKEVGDRNSPLERG